MLPLVTVQGDVHNYREMANCTSIGRRPYLLLPRYAHTCRAEHYPLPNIPYATKCTRYTHHNTCVSEDESMNSSIPACIIVPN